MSQEGPKDGRFLTGKDDLKDFRLVQMFEVFDTDEEGQRRKPFGVLGDEELAKAWSATKPSSWHPNSVRKIWVLTNGKLGFVVLPEQVYLVDDEKARRDVTAKALDKLSPEERKVLGV